MLNQDVLSNPDIVQLTDYSFLIEHEGRSIEHFYEKHNLLQILENLDGQTKSGQKINYFIYAHNGPKYSPILKEVPLEGCINILLYLSEETGFIPTELLGCFDLIFKSYLQKPHTEVIPLPLICPDDILHLDPIPSSSRKHSYFFSGNINFRRLSFLETLSPIRIPRPINSSRFKSIKKRLPDMFERVAQSEILLSSNFRGGMDAQSYAEALNESKIALCPEGFFSRETFRHYEAARQGCIVFTTRLPSLPFYRNAPFIQLNSWKQWQVIANDLLSDIDKCSELQEKTLNWYDQHLGPKAISLYIKKHVHEKSGI